jgi:transcriptional antiterminator Rof (Rho-off)
MDFRKFQTLMEVDLFDYFELGCLFDSIVHLSQHKTFQLNGFFKLEILLMEFGNYKT